MAEHALLGNARTASAIMHCKPCKMNDVVSIEERVPRNTVLMLRQTVSIERMRCIESVLVRASGICPAIGTDSGYETGMRAGLMCKRDLEIPTT
jgi:hypothetical protein